MPISKDAGKLIDGRRRFAHVLVKGRKTIIGVPFPEMPKPDSLQEL
ncbi:MAG: hypothetical protein VX893_07705 [Candidatus Latescibacterota bacterium]|jgi:hypothetical protein|nr:hypothetical protein [Candidatus Latescibacterota bacterium]